MDIFPTADALIFDLDGTLWDTTRTVALARNRALQRLGITGYHVTPEDVARTVGLPVDEIYRRGFPGLPDETLAQLRLVTAKEIARLIPVEGASLYPGVKQGLPRLRSRYTLYIVSNCNAGYIEAFLEWSGTGAFFTDHECWGVHGREKSENIRAVIARNGLRSPIYIGDTASDQAAAIRAGLPFLHVAYGFGRPGSACPSFASFDELVIALLD